MERSDVLKLLKEKNLTLSSMESVTGGKFAAAVTDIPGASQVYKGTMVSYNDDVKIAFGVKKETIEHNGAISMECAKEMAIRASLYFDTTVAVSFTGNAGPDAQEDKPIGLVYFAIRVKDKLYSYKLQFQGDRDLIRRQCVDFAFKTIQEKVSELN